MTTKELMYAAQQNLQSSTETAIRRSHVYELLVASFGFSSYAAFKADRCVFCDSDLDLPKPAVTPELIRRMMSLSYPSEKHILIAESLVGFAASRRIGYVRLPEFIRELTLVDAESDDDEQDDDGGDGSDELGDAFQQVEMRRESFRASQLLVDGLQHLTETLPGEAHFALALLNRCELPSSYLYDESLKGRQLTKLEQSWVDHYLTTKPLFEKFENHLRQAAAHGYRQAAAEYAEAIGDRGHYEAANHGEGTVSPLKMARLADAYGDEGSRLKWLRRAAEAGSRKALEDLAGRGDFWAQRQLAEAGDIDAIAHLAEVTLTSNAEECWMWASLSKMLGVDLTESTLRAYHDGGLYDGQPYDDDCGGPLYVAGEEGIDLPSVSPEQLKQAMAKAKRLYRRINSSHD